MLTPPRIRFRVIQRRAASTDSSVAHSEAQFSLYLSLDPESGQRRTTPLFQRSYMMLICRAELVRVANVSHNLPSFRRLSAFPSRISHFHLIQPNSIHLIHCH